MKEQKVQDRYLQPRGITTGRTLCHTMLASVIPMGNSAGGAGLKCIVIMWLIHHFGGFLFPLCVRQENRLHKFYLRLQRLREQK
jgi:hypothetical protein